MYSGKPTCKWEQLLLRWPDYKWLQPASLILHWDNNILICRKSYSQALFLHMGIGLSLLLFKGCWSHGCSISPITHSVAKENEALPKSTEGNLQGAWGRAQWGRKAGQGTSSLWDQRPPFLAGLNRPELHWETLWELRPWQLKGCSSVEG